VKLHGNARLNPGQRRLLCQRVDEERRTVGDAADAAGISERRAYEWLRRWRQGDRVLDDRSSAPKRIPNRTPARVVAVIERLRRLRMTSTAIAAKLEMAVSTVGAVLQRIGLHRLSRLELPEPPNRYCRRHSGELIHIDIKRLSRFVRPGHRVTGRGAKGWRSALGKGFEYCHVAIDDTSRVAYVEILPQSNRSDMRGVLGTGNRLVRRSERHRRADHDRQRAWLPIEVPRPSGATTRDQTHLHPCASATDQRKSRAVHPNDSARMGFRSRLPDQRPPQPSTGTVAPLLQSPTTPRRPLVTKPRKPYTRGSLNNLAGNYS
jgi:transposase